MLPPPAKLLIRQFVAQIHSRPQDAKHLATKRSSRQPGAYAGKMKGASVFDVDPRGQVQMTAPVRLSCLKLKKYLNGHGSWMQAVRSDG